VLGSACARELARTGRAVLVLEPDQPNGPAWRASAGMLAPQIDAHEDHPLFELGVAGREYYREKAEELASESGVDIGLFEGGIVRLARGAAEESRLRESVAWQRQRGHLVDWLDPAEVRSEFPWVGANDGALHAPHDGSVDPNRLVEALRGSAIAHGARFEAKSAVSIGVEGSRVVSVGTVSGQVPAGDVVLAAGAWTGRLEGLPRPVSVEPVRGQMLAKPWPAKVPPGIIYGSDGYVLERNGEALCGATVEHAGFSAEVTDAGAKCVADATAGLLPALASLPVVRRWTGLRPGTPDGLPIVGPEPSVPNLWYATGHGRNGILLAGITGVMLSHLLAGESTFDGLEMLRPERFWSW